MVDMGTVWDRTTEFLSDNFGAIVPMASLAILLPLVVTGVVQQPGAVDPILTQVLQTLLLVPIIWGQLLIVAFALDPDAGRRAARSVATRRLVPAIAAALILFAVMALLAAPMLIALVMGGVDVTAILNGSPGSQPALSPGLAAFVGGYFFLWLVVIILITIRVSALLYPVVVAQGGIVSAIRGSYAAGRGIVWKMIGVYLLFLLVLIVAHIAMTTVFGALFRFLAPGAGPFGVGSIVVAVLAGLLHTAYYAIISTFSAKLYRAIVAKREFA